MTMSTSILLTTCNSPLRCYLKYTNKLINITLKDITTYSLLIHLVRLKQNFPALSPTIKREGKKKKKASEWEKTPSVTALNEVRLLIFLPMPVTAVNVFFYLKTCCSQKSQLIKLLPKYTIDEILAGQ